jgi:hypothetical protein
VLGAKVAAPLKPNLVIGRYTRVGDGSPRALLDQINRARLARDPRFKVLGSSTRRLGGAAAVVQDSRSATPTGVPLYQREIVRADADGLVVLVLTSTKEADLEGETARFFEGSEVAAKVGGVDSGL